MRVRGGLLCTLLLAVLAWPAAADARPRLAGVFDLTGTPGYISRGPDGNIWTTISGSSENNTLARITPGGTVTEFAPAAVVNPVGIAPGPDGNLWLTRNGGVIKVPPGDPNAAVDTDIADITDPRRIVRGPGGRMWTASGDQLVSFLPSNPAGATATTIDGMAARGIDVSDEKLWIADFGGQRIVRAKPAGGVKFYNVGGGPQEVARGPKGSIAFANPGTDPQTIGRIEKGKKPRKTNVPNTDPFGVTFAKDGNWWFAAFATHQLLIMQRDGEVRRFRKLPDNCGPRHIARGQKGTLFVALETSQQVARIKGVKRKKRRR